MTIASALPTVNAVAAVVAAIAALVTILYARRTVAEAKAASEDLERIRAATDAALLEQRSAAQASAAEHSAEMAERKRAISAELGVQRLAQLQRISELLLLLADVAREEERNPPEPLGPGISGTRLPGILKHLRNSITVLEALGGPRLLKAGPLAARGYGAGSQAIRFLGDAIDAFEEIDSLVRADETVRNAAPPSVGA